MLRILLPAVLLLTIFTPAGPADKYAGPYPPKPDVPYLVHADNLIETEAAEAKYEEGRNDTTAWVPGAASSVRTPLAEPIFLIEVQKIVPEKLELYKFKVQRGRREATMPNSAKGSKNASRPLRLTFTRLDAKLYRIEANEALENGEYSLSQSGEPISKPSRGKEASEKDLADLAFCFQVY